MSQTDQSPLTNERETLPVRLIPESENRREEIREQLTALLESPPFRSSKRCAAFLGHVVEKCLRGETDELKERAIGIDLFHRDPAYDTSSDPVVRMAAVETRRRLAQCYDDAAQRKKIRIQIPHGSYVPEFYGPSDPEAGDGSHILRGSSASTSTGESDSAGLLYGTGRPLNGVRSGRLRFAIPAVCVAFGVLLSLAANHLLRGISSASVSALDQFWLPLVKAPGSVWMCLGETYATGIELNPNGARSRFASPYQLTTGAHKVYPALDLAETATAARVAGLLKSRNKDYSLHDQTETEFSDLAHGPSVLIGSFNNDWAIRLSDQLRFHFEMDRDAGEQWIADMEKPDMKIGLSPIGLDAPRTRDTFAIISRVRGPSTNRMVVALSGESAEGTRAAGTFVSEPLYLEEFAKKAPRNWQNANVQIVISAPVIDGALGPPRVVSSYVW